MRSTATLALAAAPVLALGLALGFAACEPSAKQQAADLAGIQATLEEYLPRLAETYRTGDVRPLEGIAAAKEMATVEKRLEELHEQGRTLEPVFRGVTVEQVNTWSHSNAFVTTVEVWDLQVYTLGSHQLLSEEMGQRSRVKYQLKRDGERWNVLYRTIVE